MNPIRFLKDLRFALFYRGLTRRNVPLVTRGGVCPWTYNAAALGPASHLLCAGAGHDISFEKELIAAHGSRVVLLDPSPTGIATVQQENLAPEQLRFMPVGVAGKDGVLCFEAPLDATEGSFRKSESECARFFEFPCKSLSTLMNELGWSRIDLLKIDIEGSEYEVIQEILTNRLDVRQICVEFHYGPAFGHTRLEMIRAILALRRAGYDLVHRIHWDHTFLRRL